jgi:hypothetical protein
MRERVGGEMSFARPTRRLSPVAQMMTFAGQIALWLAKSTICRESFAGRPPLGVRTVGAEARRRERQREAPGDSVGLENFRFAFGPPRPDAQSETARDSGAYWKWPGGFGCATEGRRRADDLDGSVPLRASWRAASGRPMLLLRFWCPWL